MRYAIPKFAFALFVSSVSTGLQTGSGPPKAAPQESTRQYFPPGVFGQNVQLSAYKERWYASFLAAMREPSLVETARNDDSTQYRFLMVLNGRALSFRLELLVDGTGELTMKRAILHPDKPNSVLVNGPVTVSAEKVREFLTLLQKAKFWELETEEASDKTRYGMDGTQWVLEGVRNREYHVVDRWSPKNTDFTRVCFFLLKLAPIDLGEDSEKKEQER
jgi:hypothetical protein